MFEEYIGLQSKLTAWRVETLYRVREQRHNLGQSLLAEVAEVRMLRRLPSRFDVCENSVDLGQYRLIAWQHCVFPEVAVAADR
jgi:hypothetical protein